MFLTSQTRPMLATERGSALMAVVGVMAVTVVIGLTITVATFNGLGATSGAKASVQSRAAAAAGVNVAVATLPRIVGCPLTLPSAPGNPVTGDPKYDLALEYLNSAGLPVTPAGDCSIASRVKITSTGYSQTPVRSGASSGGRSKLESIFAYNVPSGAAIYLANGANFNNGGSITSTVSVPAIQVKTGNFDCDNNTAILGSIVVVAGTISLKKCTIGGDAWASGTATFPPPGGTVTGALTAALPKPASGYGTWNPGAPMPAVPNWTEFSYLKSDWVTAAGVGFTEVLKPATTGDCVIPQANGSTPVIFNALACGGVTDSGDVTLANDLVVVAKKFTFGSSMHFKSLDAVAHKVWFITPDLDKTDGLATCGAQGAFKIGQQFTIETTVSAMLYTPCGIDAGNGFTWNGQIYAGKIDSWNNAVFNYVGVGLPGTNLTNGTYTPGGASGSPANLGDLLSSRDVVG